MLLCHVSFAELTQKGFFKECHVTSFMLHERKFLSAIFFKWNNGLIKTPFKLCLVASQPCPSNNTMNYHGFILQSTTLNTPQPQ
uniref:Uncharacterized protein n=1 Tax=Anguilla anguilla TaxID=7936 RepID=A0A0E9X4Q7_ANGAN